MNNVINTHKITKKFGPLLAVNNLNLNINKAEIYGFIGLNGAGKTTTIKMLLGMIKPSSGYAEILDTKISASCNNIWDKVGYMVEIPYAYPNLTVKENLELFRKLKMVKNKNCINNVIQLIQLQEYENKKVKHLSQGNAQRLGLAKALLNNPEVLILDEPTNGLDPSGIVEIRNLLKNLAENQGVTILISSHILDELARFCTKVGIIHKGVLINELSNTSLHQLFEKQLIISSLNPDATVKLLLAHNYNARQENKLIKISGKDAISDPGKIASLMVNSGVPPTLLKVEEENLESYFLRTIQKNQANIQTQ